MRTFGLIGYPLSHSFSKKYFTEKFEANGIQDCRYEIFPIGQISELPALIERTEGLTGLNVTIPHKVSVIPFLTELDEAAAAIGAVNCIRINKATGSLKGYNTDATGFRKSLEPLLRPWHTRALIFGSGGASKAVQFVLKQLNIPYTICTRDGEGMAYSAIDKAVMDAHTLLVDTTPLGMEPNFDTLVDIPYQHITTKHLAYDLVYNPEETAFLKQSLANGAVIKNGLEMLHLQAEESWYIWNQ